MAPVTVPERLGTCRRNLRISAIFFDRGLANLGELTSVWPVGGAGEFSQPQNERKRHVNKNDLIASVASGAGMSKTDASSAVEALLGSISGALKIGDEVRIVGFGTFSVSHRAASRGRNPRTGQAIAIPASKTPKFKAGKQLKDAVNS